MRDETERRAEDAATEGGQTDYDDDGEQIERAPEVTIEQERSAQPRTSDEPIGDPRYQAGGLATGERGRQSGARIESGDEEPGEPSEEEL